MADASLNPAVMAFTTALAIVTGLVVRPRAGARPILRGSMSTVLKDDYGARLGRAAAPASRGRRS